METLKNLYALLNLSCTFFISSLDLYPKCRRPPLLADSAVIFLRAKHVYQ